MSSAEAKTSTSPLVWIGRILSTLPVLALVMSGIMKFVKPAGFSEGFQKLGFPESVASGLGIVELVSTVLYVIPQTSALGAILLTGYLGGATAAHVRINEPVIPPILLGVMLWGGLYLRDPRVRSLIPFRT